MATFYVTVCTAARGAWANGSTVQVASANGLYFGSSARATWAKKINVGNYNDSMHVSNTTASGTTDKCAGSHAHTVKYIAAATAQFDNGGSSALTVVSTSRCIQIMLNFGASSFSVNPIYMWFGQGSQVTTAPGNASCKAFQKRYGSYSTAGLAWAEPTNSSKLTLYNMSTASSQKWYVAMSVKPFSAGFNNLNKFKVEATYY